VHQRPPSPQFEVPLEEPVMTITRCAMTLSRLGRL
jgi:hypothetical protein